MATETNCVCDVCHVRHIRSTVREYCPQCDQNLCENCSEHHRIAEASKTHQTITFEQYKELPPFIQNIKHRCDQHGYPFEFHCQLHTSLACKRCIVMEHRTCDDLVLLEDVVSDSNSSAALERLENSLQGVKSIITTAISKSKDNLKILPINEDNVVERIKDMRKNINFDKLEQDLILKVTQSKVKGKRYISRVLQDLETENKQVNEISKNIEVLKECASGRQSFIGTRNLQQSLQQLTMQLQSMYEKGDFHDVKICCEFDDSFVNKEEAVGSIGCVLPRKVNVGFTLKKIADGAGQTKDYFKIDGVTVKQLERLRVYGNEITACMMLKENITLFLNRDMDRHSKILKFISGDFEGDINLLPASVFDIAYLDEKRVLVTTRDSSKSMKVFDMDQPRARRHLKMNDSCYGITSNKQVFIFCTNNCIKVLDYDALSVSNFPADFENVDLQETYLTANENNLFLSDYHRDTVTCYDFSGKVVWTFSDKAILENPRGIALDDRSNVYIAGSMSNNVVIMTSIGKRARELLGLADGLVHPHAIYFDKDDDILLVSNLTGPAFKYSITVKHVKE
ncbi:uncharacterized protein LOC127712081 [Mytilus californianus]|uniref:uncharacterized protein LOC127712081 n=1 Tax=Mytilus californianus TaxID=6549 RepID=UPI0022477CC7|nr:uncharacterized protein LOC127712081 [Mytilus californianus]XP_052074246.1 uncharacterized protein LOC127712081 [Mytilus californianus]